MGKTLGVRAGDLVWYAPGVRTDANDNGGVIESPDDRDAAYGRPLRVVQWNIERGYRLDGILGALRTLDADVLMLQELDAGCDRSAGRDCAAEIAAATGMYGVLFVEFEELRSRRRSRHTQGGGVHGNAIFSRWPIAEAWTVPHTTHPVDWERAGERLGEPRRGQRMGLGALIHAPGLDAPLVVYSLHLEVFCGMLDRVRQFADVLADSWARSAAGAAYQIVGGDLNTLGHGIARLARCFCGDRMRVASLGYSEAAWWHYHVLGSVAGALDSLPADECLFDDDAFPALPSAPPPPNDRLAPHGVSAPCNNWLYDPFDPEAVETLRARGGIFRGKLDWLLLRGLAPVHTDVGNRDYKLSDHRWLMADVEPVLCAAGSDPGPVAYAAGYVPVDYPLRRRLRVLLYFVLTAVIFCVFLFIS